MKLDGNSAVPLYEQMKIQLQEQIAAQIYAAGDRLPAEKELCEKYGVSRITLRRAVDELVAEGILERKQGKGTFVAAQKSRLFFRSFGSMGGGFTDSQYPENVQKEIIVISKKEYICNTLEQEALHLTKGDRVMVLLRLMKLDGQPLMLDRSVYPIARFPGLFDRIKDGVSTYALFRELFGINKMRCTKELSLAYATDEQAKLLCCIPAAPLFRIFKQVRDDKDKPVHLSNLYYVAERIIFTDDGN